MYRFHTFIENEVCYCSTQNRRIMQSIGGVRAAENSLSASMPAPELQWSHRAIELLSNSKKIVPLPNPLESQIWSDSHLYSEYNRPLPSNQIYLNFLQNNSEDSLKRILNKIFWLKNGSCSKWCGWKGEGKYIFEAHHKLHA